MAIGVAAFIFLAYVGFIAACFIFRGVAELTIKLADGWNRLFKR
jgi:hypothetical protein